MAEDREWRAGAEGIGQRAGSTEQIAEGKEHGAESGGQKVKKDAGG